MKTAGRYGNPQAPWRWDDQTNTLIRDRDATNEKADLKAETASEKVDLWNLPSGKRPQAYEKYPLELSKHKKSITIGDIIRRFIVLFFCFVFNFIFIYILAFL
jgi:hypothetical protein